MNYIKLERSWQPDPQVSCLTRHRTGLCEGSQCQGSGEAGGSEDLDSSQLLRKEDSRLSGLLLGEFGLCFPYAWNYIKSLGFGN